MTDCRITCITKSQSNGSYSHITHVGSPNFNQSPWTVEIVIGCIDRKEHTFYVQAPSGKRADVAVVREAGQRPYLRTYADGLWTDNLLSLPAC
jgi:hypothetical protein